MLSLKRSLLIESKNPLTEYALTMFLYKAFCFFARPLRKVDDMKPPVLVKKTTCPNTLKHSCVAKHH